MVHYFTKADIEALPSRYRGVLCNTFTAPKPAFLLGTRSKEGIDNLAIFSQVFHLGANPFLIGCLVRPDVVERHTLNNLDSNPDFTLSAVTTTIYRHAHQTSAKYPAEVSEFDAVGLTRTLVDGFNAAAVQESPLQLGLQLAERIDLKSNGTILLIGAVQWARLDSMIEADGFRDVAADQIVACGGLDSYYRLELLGRLPYAKP